MTNIITTKDLTKNELSGAKILAAFVILAGLGVFLNFARMDHKALPEISFTAMPAQAVDGSGLVSFSVNLNKISDYNTKLKIEYSFDGNNYLPAVLSVVDIDAGSLVSAGDSDYQVAEINSGSDSANVNFVWDTKATADDFSGEQTKIKITLAYDLKDKDDKKNNKKVDPELLPNDNNTENSEVEINNDEVIIGEDVIIDSEQNSEDQPDFDLPALQTSADVISEPVSASGEASDVSSDISSQSQGEVNTLTVAIIDTAEPEDESLPVTVSEADEIWSELSVISDNFKVDNVAPEMETGKINMDKALIRLNFSEQMNTEYLLSGDQIKLQNEILAESLFSWLNKNILVISLSASENEKISAQTGDLILEIGDNNLQDLSGNNFNGGQITLGKQTDEIAEPEDEDEPDKKDEEGPEQEEEIKEDDEKVEGEEEEEEEIEEIVIPENNKIINTRGYNKNCSFNPDELVMLAGEIAQAELNLSPLDLESEYVLTTSTLPNDFEVKILQPSGTGTGPINLEIIVPANAVPRLYKLLIKYKDITPQSVSYVHNCVLRLTVQ